MINPVRHRFIAMSRHDLVFMNVVARLVEIALPNDPKDHASPAMGLWSHEKSRGANSKGFREQTQGNGLL
jgi:hypothetical protein